MARGVDPGPRSGPTEVKWHPPATHIRDGSSVFGGIAPVEVRWRGRKWTVVWSEYQKTLWVMADTDAEVKDINNALDLASLAQEYRKNHGRALDAETADNSVEAVSARGEDIAKGGKKRRSLDDITKAAQYAIAAGATREDIEEAVVAALGFPRPDMIALTPLTDSVQWALGTGAKLQDVRVAVYSAMGLDEGLVS